MIRKNNLLGMFLLIAILFVPFTSAYSRSSPYIIQQGGSGLAGLFGTGVPEQTCDPGQDFLIQTAPFGCTPAVVRSDLLEQQDVPVFCQIAATKVNPLITVDAINNINFVGNMPNGVRGISIIPSASALAPNQEVLNSPFLNNIGYAVIVLKQQKNESSMPNSIQGTVTAQLKYDIKNAFGIGQSSFYLPEIKNDQEWQDKSAQYSFWKGRGYVRAESIGTNDARIDIYSGTTREQTFNLNVGDTSGKFYLPGFDCLAGLTVKLNKLDNPGTRAALSVNGGNLEVNEGENFIDNNCNVVGGGIKNWGIVKRVSVYCSKADDSKDRSFNLEINPQVELEINGVKNNFTLGQKLYDGADKSVFLGYVGTTSDSSKDLYIYTFATPTDISRDHLTDQEIESVVTLADGYQDEKYTGNKVADFIANRGKNLIAATINTWQYLKDGKSYTQIDLSDTSPTTVEGIPVRLVGFLGPRNIDVGSDATVNYKKAMEDFDKIISDYPSTVYPSSTNITKGEEAFVEKINLAFKTGQMQDLLDFCGKFKDKYPTSQSLNDVKDYCDNAAILSSNSIPSRSVTINRQVYDVTFKGVIEPSIDDYGIELKVQGPNGKEDNFKLRSTQKIYLDSFRGDGAQNNGEYIQLIDLSDTSATLDTYIEDNQNILKQAGNLVFSTSRESLVKGITTNIRGYSFTVTQINLKKVAQVSLQDDIQLLGSDANFSFKIGIEKRGIQLSPDQIKNKIDTLNKTINDWQDKSNKLGTLVQGMKAACLATDAVLTVKNFLANTGGKSIARQNVMRGDGGWYSICENLVRTNSAEYPNINSCLSKHSSDIDNDVNTYYDQLQKQDTEIKNIQSKYQESGAFGQQTVNTQEFSKAYLDSIRSDLKTNLKTKFGGDTATIDGEKINIDDLVNKLDASTTSVDQLRDLELTSKMSGSDAINNMAKTSLITDVKTIYVNTKDEIARTTLSSQFGVDVDYGADPGLKDITITKDIIFSQVSSEINYVPYTIDPNSYVRIYVDKSSGNKYLLALDNDRHVSQTYLIGADNKLTLQDKTNPLNLDFNKVDASSYKNAYVSSIGDTVPVLKYYETDPYKGYPAIVPFDEKNGWYVSVTQTLPIGANIRSYDTSGRVNSFYLCNVGSNGKEENRGGDDTCRMFVNGQTYDQFPGLGSGQTGALVQRAINAVEQAQKAYHSGVSQVTITGFSKPIKVGSPAADISDLQCQDFMSPKDCQILFNVCDPVICPSSRCNLGGKFPVQDVIQTGIFGSLALCLPNYQEGIYIPVCLSGLKAGIDGWLSVEKSYKDCLQQNLNTGQTVGICDEINSVYQCEFFWKQAIPIAQLAVPKIIETAMGQGTRGGGEYLGVASAWANAQKSIDYFSQIYAANSYKAFQARSTEEVGTSACKLFVSGVFPTSASGLDALTQPDSPPQFTGWFDEVPFTTATNPPTSQYKVFYHIYAGKDSGVYYKVYLKGSPGSSFYQDTSSFLYVNGAQGYIATGDYATNTVDFTATSGYTQLCIMVNNQEQCGFKKVSTDFALNYVADQYAASEASQSNITTTSTCVSGSASAYALVNPNIENGVSNVINPQISSMGITRTCATDNPGKGTDVNWQNNNSRWASVGYCDDPKMICWLDTNSVKDAIKNSGIESDTLSGLSDKTQALLAQSGNYILTDQQFEDEYAKVTEVMNQTRINDLTILLDKVFLDYHKSQVLLQRGITYESLAGNQVQQKRIADELARPLTPEEQTAAEQRQAEETQTKLLESLYIDFQLDEGGGFLFFGGGDDLHYIYKNDGWYFYKSDISLAMNVLNLQGLTSSDISSASLDMYHGLSTDNKKFINSLIDKSYSEGLIMLMERADKNGWTLSTDYVVYGGGTKNFQTTQASSLGITGWFEYDQGWKWSSLSFSSGSNWFDVSEISNTSLYSDNLVKVSKSLVDTSYYNGAEILFGLNLVNSVSKIMNQGGTTVNLPGVIPGLPFIIPGISTSVNITKKCEDCGIGLLNICTKVECDSLTLINEQECEFTSNFLGLGGSCVTKPVGAISGVQPVSVSAEELSNLIDNTMANKIPGTYFSSSCKQYANYVSDATAKIGVDPVLLFAVMYQESSCNKNTPAGIDSYGLMQVNVIHCGEAGISLPSNKEDCKNQLISDLQLNINVGAQLLKKAYDTYGDSSKKSRYDQLIKNYCKDSKYQKKYLTYTGWSAALRGYNGLGCDTGADVNYVETVLQKYNKILEYGKINS
jgi:hypothetical protein